MASKEPGWLAFARRHIGVRASAWGGGGVVAVLAVVQTLRIDRLKTELTQAKAQAIALAQRLDDAAVSAQSADDRCVAQIAGARQSARAIEHIIERPVHVDPNGCPVRELVPADQLREALQPGVAAAEPVY